MKQYARGIGLALAAVLAVVALTFGGFALKVAIADWVGAGKQTLATKGNTQYRIAAYDTFFNLCAAVQAKEDAIKNVELELETADEARAEQLRPALTALRNTRAEMIHRYNADAMKHDTRGNFRASNLPYDLDTKGTTTCAL